MEKEKEIGKETPEKGLEGEFEKNHCHNHIVTTT